MPNTIAYANPENGEIRGVVGHDKRGEWYGTVWVENGELGMSGNFPTQDQADSWVRGQLGMP